MDDGERGRVVREESGMRRRETARAEEGLRRTKVYEAGANYEEGEGEIREIMGADERL